MVMLRSSAASIRYVLRSLLAVLIVLALPAAAVAEAADGAAPGTAAEAAPQRLFDAQSFMLDNGMQVVVVENHRVPVVSHMVWYKVGAADEPPGKSGIAHLLEHLMFKGTDNIAPGEFSKIVARHGGQDNAFTSSDYTAYYQNIAREHLALVMEMEADRMRNLKLDEQNVLTERDVVVEERLSRIENEPAAILGERLDVALWMTHPYRNPVIGWAHELGQLDLSDAIDFYSRYYAPNNAILVVSGDVTVDEVRRLAERYYGPVPRGPDIRRAEVREHDLPPPARIEVTMHHPRVAQPQWRRQYIAPSYQTQDEDDRVYALQVLSELLGSGPTSRLYRSLVVEQELAAAAGSWYSPRAVDWGTFGLYATPRPGVDIERLAQAMEAEIARLLREGVTEEEVETAKTRMRAGVIYARDSLQGAAHTIGAALATGGTLEQVETWPQHIAEVTRDEVVDAARAVLRDNAVATGILLPEEPVVTARDGAVPTDLPPDVVPGMPGGGTTEPGRSAAGSPEKS